MSKLADYVCPPVPIPSAEATVGRYLKSLEGSDITILTTILIENLSGQTLKLADHQCASGKWAYGPSAQLRDGHTMVLIAGQPPLSLGGVGTCVVLTAPDFAISCCAETTVMKDSRINGAISENEERIAETIFRESIDSSSAEAVAGRAAFGSLILEWGGSLDTRIFSVYPVIKENIVAKWRKINESVLERTSVICLSAGSVLHMINVQHTSLFRFLEATLAGALRELNYVEDAVEAKEVLEEEVRYDLRQSVEGVWEEFDKNKNGTLDEEECQVLMAQFFALFVHEAPGIIGRLLVRQKEDPQHYSYKLADDAVEKMQRMIGALEAKDLSKDLFQDMWNVEGQVTKADFAHAFLATMQRLLQPVKQVVLETKEAEERLELQIERETGKKREKPVRPWKDAVSRRLRCECF
eukprot:GGOE01042059.1.p1 GENE.GGOE01042059.1~~GGOE01042059.1.p1  ORF type:complete len:411 (-),score=153.28 GGOE01042059.1:125-1357(-)